MSGALRRRRPASDGATGLAEAARRPARSRHGGPRSTGEADWWRLSVDRLGGAAAAVR
jgi:hypothetical protein